MPGPDNEMQFEWRKTVMDRLSQQDRSMDKMKEDLTAIRLNTAQTSSLLQMEGRVRSLEDFRLRTITLLVFVQAGLAAIFALASKWFFH